MHSPHDLRLRERVLAAAREPSRRVVVLLSGGVAHFTTEADYVYGLSRVCRPGAQRVGTGDHISFIA